MSAKFLVRLGVVGRGDTLGVASCGESASSDNYLSQTDEHVGPTQCTEQQYECLTQDNAL